MAEGTQIDSRSKNGFCPQVVELSPHLPVIQKVAVLALKWHERAMIVAIVIVFDE